MATTFYVPIKNQEVVVKALLNRSIKFYKALKNAIETEGRPNSLLHLKVFYTLDYELLQFKGEPTDAEDIEYIVKKSSINITNFYLELLEDINLEDKEGTREFFNLARSKDLFGIIWSNPFRVHPSKDLLLEQVGYNDPLALRIPSHNYIDSFKGELKYETWEDIGDFEGFLEELRRLFPNYNYPLVARGTQSVINTWDTLDQWFKDNPDGLIDIDSKDVGVEEREYDVEHKDDEVLKD
jgi:hypothetical protein